MDIERLLSVKISGRPHGQHRPRCVCRGKHADAYPDKSDVQYRKHAVAEIREQCRTLRIQVPIEGPLMAIIGAVYPRLKAQDKEDDCRLCTYNRQCHDIDNIEKAVIDAMADAKTGAKLFSDKGIEIMFAWKAFAASGEEPYAKCTIYRINQEFLNRVSYTAEDDIVRLFGGKVTMPPEAIPLTPEELF